MSVLKKYVYFGVATAPYRLALLSLLQGAEFEILGSATNPSAVPEYVKSVVQVPRPSEGPLETAAVAKGDLTSALLPSVSRCQVCVYYLPGNEQESIEAVLAMQKSVAGPVLPGQKEKVFIGITHPMAWANTKAQARFNPETGEPEPLTITAADEPNRQGASSCRDLVYCERFIERCRRKGALATYIVCPGLLYGRGEHRASLGLLDLFTLVRVHGREGRNSCLGFAGSTEPPSPPGVQAHLISRDRPLPSRTTALVEHLRGAPRGPRSNMLGSLERLLDLVPLMQGKRLADRPDSLLHRSPALAALLQRVKEEPSEEQQAQQEQQPPPAEAAAKPAPAAAPSMRGARASAGGGPAAPSPAPAEPAQPEEWGFQSLPVFGEGANALPVCHIGYLAGYVTQVALHNPAAHYLLVADPPGPTQLDLVTAISTAFGISEAPKKLKREAVLRSAGFEHMQLDLPMVTTVFPRLAPEFADPAARKVPALATEAAKVVAEFDRDRILGSLRRVHAAPVSAGSRGSGF